MYKEHNEHQDELGVRIDFGKIQEDSSPFNAFINNYMLSVFDCKFPLAF